MIKVNHVNSTHYKIATYILKRREHMKFETMACILIIENYYFSHPLSHTLFFLLPKYHDRGCGMVCFLSKSNETMMVNLTPDRST